MATSRNYRVNQYLVGLHFVGIKLSYGWPTRQHGSYSVSRPEQRLNNQQKIVYEVVGRPVVKEWLTQ